MQRQPFGRSVEIVFSQEPIAVEVRELGVQCDPVHEEAPRPALVLACVMVRENWAPLPSLGRSDVISQEKAGACVVAVGTQPDAEAGPGPDDGWVGDVLANSSSGVRRAFSMQARVAEAEGRVEEMRQELLRLGQDAACREARLREELELVQARARDASRWQALAEGGADAMRRVDVLEARNASLHKELAAREAELRSLDSVLGDVTESMEVEVASTCRSRVGKRFSNLRAQCRALETENLSLTNRLRTACERVEALSEIESRYAARETVIQIAREEMAKASSERDKALCRASDCERELADALARLEAVTRENRRLARQLATAEKWRERLQEAEVELGAVQEKERELREDYRDMVAHAQLLQGHLSEKRASRSAKGDRDREWGTSATSRGRDARDGSRRGRDWEAGCEPSSRHATSLLSARLPTRGPMDGRSSTFLGT